MPYCPQCGKQVAESDNFCRGCGFDLAAEVSNEAPKVEPETPTEVTEKPSPEPIARITKMSPLAPIEWNWGAFFWTWIWGICNNVWIALLALTPIGNIIMPFVLGAKGSQWAWENKDWDGEEHFIRIQHRWSFSGVLLFLLLITVPLFVL